MKIREHRAEQRLKLYGGSEQRGTVGRGYVRERGRVLRVIWKLKNCGYFVPGGLYLNNHTTELAETSEFDFAGPNMLREIFPAQLELVLLLGEVEKGLMWWGFRIFGVVLPLTGV